MPGSAYLPCWCFRCELTLAWCIWETVQRAWATSVFNSCNRAVIPFIIIVAAILTWFPALPVCINTTLMKEHVGTWMFTRSRSKKQQHQSEPRPEHWRPFFECLSFKSLHIMAGEGHCKRLCMMQFLRHDSNYCNSTAVSRMATENVKVGAPSRIAGPWGLTSYHRWHHHKIRVEPIP